MDNERKAFKLWEQWMIEDSKLFDELLKKENESDYGDK